MWRNAAVIPPIAEATFRDAIVTLPRLLSNRINAKKYESLVRRFDAILRIITQSVVFVDDETVEVVVNPAGAELLGLVSHGKVESPKVAQALKRIAENSGMLTDFQRIMDAIAGKDDVLHFKEDVLQLFYEGEEKFCLVFFLPNVVVDAYGSLARFGSGLFLLVQVLILLDFTHTWNAAWLEKDEQFWYITLLVASIVCGLGSFVLSGFLFYWFNSAGQECQLHIFFIVFDLIFGLGFAFVSLHPQINGNLLPASVIALYCTYLCYKALSSQPSERVLQSSINAVLNSEAQEEKTELHADEVLKAFFRTVSDSDDELHDFLATQLEDDSTDLELADEDVEAFEVHDIEQAVDEHDLGHGWSASHFKAEVWICSLCDEAVFSEVFEDATVLLFLQTGPYAVEVSVQGKGRIKKCCPYATGHPSKPVTAQIASSAMRLLLGYEILLSSPAGATEVENFLTPLEALPVENATPLASWEPSVESAASVSQETVSEFCCAAKKPSEFQLKQCMSCKKPE